MSTTTEAPPAVVSTAAGKSGAHWIDHWEPENEQFWESTGRAIARKNLAISIFCEHLGFCIWVLWTIVVLNLADAGIVLTVPQLFWLTAVPNLIGSALRIPYTFAIARFGGRLWTTISAMLLFVPVLVLAVIVPSHWLATQSPNSQFWILMACAATAGVGGGNFSSSMANISFFYPEGRKGFALGLNAAGGNLGVAVTQLLVPLALIVGVPAAAVKLDVHHVHLAYAGLMWLPFIVAAAFLAWRYMDSLTQAKTDKEAYRLSLSNPQTWIVAFLYIGTFGSFIGYSFALPLVIKNTFPEFLAHHLFIKNYLAGLGFMGALVGSLSRPLGGRLSDRIGGARVTLFSFAGMALATGIAIDGVNAHSFTEFFAAFMVIFALSGIGNGSTYRMIPSIFAALGKREAQEQGVDPAVTAKPYKRQSAAVIGIAGAIGAFGGFLIQVAFRQASLHVATLMTKATKLYGHDKVALTAHKHAIALANQNWSVPALWVFLGAYVLMGGVTWFCYLRTSLAVDRVPSLAHAAV